MITKAFPRPDNPIPTMKARQLALGYDQAIIVILAVDRSHERVHCTTYGRLADDKIEAARLGQLAVEALAPGRPSEIEKPAMVSKIQAGKQIQRFQIMHRNLQKELKRLETENRALRGVEGIE